MPLGLFVVLWFGVAGIVAPRLYEDVKYETKIKKEQKELFNHMDALSNKKHGLSVHEVYNGADVHGPENEPNGYMPRHKVR